MTEFTNVFFLTLKRYSPCLTTGHDSPFWKKPSCLCSLISVAPFSTRGIPNLLAWPYMLFQWLKPEGDRHLNAAGRIEGQVKREGTVQTKWKWWEDLMERTQVGVYGYVHIFLGKTTEHILKCRFRSLIIVEILQGLLSLCQQFSVWLLKLPEFILHPYTWIFYKR